MQKNFKSQKLNLLLLMAFLLSTFSALAQRPDSRPHNSGPMEPSSLNGRIVDESNQNALEFVPVSVYRMPKDSLINGTMSGENGNFKIENLKPGRYKLVVTFMGYQKKIIDSLRLMPGENKMIGNVLISPNVKALKEVTVTTEKDVFVQNIEKKVFNVEKSAVSAGGSATDALQQVPTVSVDVDGKVSLRGSENVTILIDGRPSGMSGSGRQGVLGGIPASAIESIEVITNPGAKYDPDGMSGIINIVLKKNKTIGTNGNVSVQAGTRNKYNANASLNYRNSKVNVFGSYSFRYNTRYGYGSINRNTYVGDSTIILNQFSNSNHINRSHNLRTGADFFLSKSNTLGLSLTGNLDNKSGDENIMSNFFNKDNVLSSDLNRDVNNPSLNQSADGNIYFKHNFNKPGTFVNVETNYSTSTGKEDFFISEKINHLNYLDTSGLETLVNNLNNSSFKLNTNMLDFEMPLTKIKAKLESGLKNINRNIYNRFYAENFDPSSDSFIADTLLFNEFRYYEHILAAYTNFNKNIDKWTLKTGLRAEQALTESVLLKTGNSYTNNYFNVYPSVFINRKLNGKKEMQLSYTKRINRPGTQQLVPFTDYSNPQIIRTGNPYLKPEYVHSFEWNFLYSPEKYNFSATIFYRRTNGLIFRNVEVVSPVQSRVSFVNLGSSDNYGIETVSRVEPVKWFNATINLNGFQTVINGSNQDGEINTSLITWNGKILANFVLPYAFNLQVSGNYNAPRVVAQGRILSNSSVDVALRKDILKGRGSLLVNVTDVFDQMYFGIKTSGSNFAQQASRKRETRIGNFSFTYRFGSNETPMKKRNRNDNEYKSDDGF